MLLSSSIICRAQYPLVPSHHFQHFFSTLENKLCFFLGGGGGGAFFPNMQKNKLAVETGNEATASGITIKAKVLTKIPSTSVATIIPVFTILSRQACLRCQPRWG